MNKGLNFLGVLGFWGGRTFRFPRMSEVGTSVLSAPIFSKASVVSPGAGNGF